MKKIALSMIGLGLLMTSFAQSENTKGRAIGVSYLLYDFKTATELKSGGLASVVRNRNSDRTDRKTQGLAFNYYQGINSQLDFVASLSGGFVKYPVPGKTEPTASKFLMDITAAANLKMLSDEYWVSPYLTLGVGASKYGGYFGAFIPAGAGIQVNLFDELFFMVNTQYRMAITENAATHVYHSFGLASSLGKKEGTSLAALPRP